MLEKVRRETRMMNQDSANKEVYEALKELSREVFGGMTEADLEPNVYADYDRLCELANRSRKAILAWELTR